MHKIGFIVFPAFSPINLAATSVFEVANWRVGSAAYDVTLLSERGGLVATSLGSQIQTSSFKRRTFDTLIIAGGIAAPKATPGLVNYLRSTVHRTRRIASICTGALVLAEAGLLDGADIALFGRMVASLPSLTLEGAAMFSHALSTHKSDNDLDFYRALVCGSGTWSSWRSSTRSSRWIISSRPRKPRMSAISPERRPMMRAASASE